MIAPLPEKAASLVFHVVGLLLVGTGEIVMSLLTLGGRMPMWRRDLDDSLVKLSIIFDVSCLVGIFFWLTASWLLLNKVFI